MKHNYSKRTVFEDFCIITVYFVWIALGVIGAISIVVPLSEFFEPSIGLKLIECACTFSLVVLGSYKAISKN